MSGTDVKTSVSVAQQPIASLNLGPFTVGGGDKQSWLKWAIVAAVAVVLIVAWRKKLI